MKIRATIGETTDSPAIGPDTSLVSKVKSQIIKSFGSPDLIHAQGAFEFDTYIELAAGEDNVIPLISDGTYLYAGTKTTPGKIIRIYLKTFTKDLVITLDGGENDVNSLIIHKDYLYAGLGTSPAKVVKINRLSFTKESTLTLDAGENIIRQLGIDGIYLYAGLYVSPGKITKINIDGFTRDSTLTFGDNLVTSICVSRGYLYAVFGTSPGILKQVRLDTFAESLSLTFDTGENTPYYIVTDGIYFYATLDLGPGGAGTVVKVAFYPELNVLSKIDVLAFTGYESVRSLVLNGTELCIGFFKSGSKIGFIDQATFKKTHEYTFGAGFNNLFYMYTDGTYIYAAHYMSPSRISRIYIMPTHDIFQKATTLLLEQMQSDIYYVYPLLAASVTLTSAAAAWTWGNYTEIIPINRIRTTFYLTGIVVNNMLIDTEYVISIATGAADLESVIATVTHETHDTNLSADILFPVPIKVSSKTRISAKCATENVAAQTCTVKLRYKSSSKA